MNVWEIASSVIINRGSRYSGHYGHKGVKGGGPGGSQAAPGGGVVGSPVGASDEFAGSLKGKKVLSDKDIDEEGGSGTPHLNMVHVVEYMDGAKAIAKVCINDEPDRDLYGDDYDRVPGATFGQSQALSDAAAYDLDVAMGLGVIPKTGVIASGPGNRDLTVVQDFVRDAKNAENFSSRERDVIISASAHESEAIAVFDFVAASRDRHEGNWMVRDKGMKPVPVDNGLAFYEKMGYDKIWNKSPFVLVLQGRGLSKGMQVKVDSFEKPQLEKVLIGFDKRVVDGCWNRVRFLQEHRRFPSKIKIWSGEL